MNIYRVALVLGICSSLAFTHRAADHGARDVQFPEGYRRWTHVRTGLSRSGTSGVPGKVDGMHHIYANSAALEGYLSGIFPQGSVIVFDLIDLPSTDGGGMNVGARKVVDVMHKDSTRFAATGGWGFDEFRADTRERTSVPIATCVQCHTSRRDHDFVFSALTDK